MPEQRTVADRIAILVGLLEALNEWPEVSAAIWNSRDLGGALATLTSPPFGFSEVVAMHIVDMPAKRLTRLGRDALAEELAALQGHSGLT